MDARWSKGSKSRKTVTGMEFMASQCAGSTPSQGMGTGSFDLATHFLSIVIPSMNVIQLGRMANGIEPFRSPLYPSATLAFTRDTSGNSRIYRGPSHYVSLVKVSFDAVLYTLTPAFPRTPVLAVA